ncbi:hypothetical protein [Anaerospora sp.]|uniref:hypothetical protein n=1 Tax=Anaerospora sp. TaxID=1960278 RepID=UPI0028A2201D|nr:hypothetical protein [Anaerospora sp.]
MISWFIGGPLLYFALALFCFKTITTVLRFLRMPRHLRWDLYPVPHQGPEGSKYQKVDFGELKPHISLYHELKEMSQEMLFIKRAFIHNPKVWKGSFPLHMGLYLGVSWLVLLTVGAMLELNGIQVASTAATPVMLLYYLTLFTGIGSFVAGLYGSLVLLWLRTFDADLRFISDYVSFLNLALLICLFGTGLAAWGLADSSFAIIRQHVSGVLLLNPSAIPSPLSAASVLLFCLFLIYLPFSRMMHFVGKYFFYHNIMWDDEMMKGNRQMENDIAAYLDYRPTWSAPHILKGGSWGEQAGGGLPQEGEQK